MVERTGLVAEPEIVLVLRHRSPHAKSGTVKRQGIPRLILRDDPPTAIQKYQPQRREVCPQFYCAGAEADIVPVLLWDTYFRRLGESIRKHRKRLVGWENSVSGIPNPNHASGQCNHPHLAIPNPELNSIRKVLHTCDAANRGPG